MGRLITAAPALIYAGAALVIAVAGVRAVVRSLRNANQLIDDICTGEENPQP